MDIRIYPPEEMLEASPALPLSKSQSNRLLIINAICGMPATAAKTAECDDTKAMIAALESGADTINIGGAGTAMRFLTAYFAAMPGRDVTIDGDDRMRQRPIGPLVDALRACGAEITYTRTEGFPPLHISGRRLTGSTITVDSTVSSQFISALLMIAPIMDNGLTIHLDGQQSSRPYIDMTLQMMADAGAETVATDDTITVRKTSYRPCTREVEADWSAASYWFEIAAISSGSVSLKGLSRKSIQGDSRISELIKVTGLDHCWVSDNEIELTPTPDAGARLIADLSDTPDLAQTLAVTCCLLSIPFRFTGLQSLKIKETDRLTALQSELGKLGFIVETGPDTLTWQGAAYNPGEEPDAIDTYGDHRMAMSFAPAALFFPGLTIKNAGVTSKSYPEFWNELQKAGFRIEEAWTDPE